MLPARFRTSVVHGAPVLLLVCAVLSLPAVHASTIAASESAPPAGADPARGLVYDGLFPSLPGSPCSGAAFEVHGRSGLVACSHGPDPAPDGIDVRVPRPLADLQASVRELGPAEVPCVGNGQSGKRVLAIYAVASDKPDRYETIAPLIRTWASFTVNDIVAASAVETGGSRAVRFVTDGNCDLVVEHVVLSPAADDDFGQTIAELRAQGYTASNRKYLVWGDATVYCGIAQFVGDDRPEPGNLNNGHQAIEGMVSRTDSGCWGLGGASTPVEAHELMHTLGSVQNSAPNSTSQFPQSPGAHCNDDHDVMCYADGPGVEIDIVCTDPNHERRLDCGHDDYFHTAPAGGSYLATHWNSATSAFLEPVQSPVITGFSPPAGAVGKMVTIDGVGFTGTTSVDWGGVNQPVFTIVSDTRIAAKVPSGALTSPISVTTPLGTGYSTTFKVRPKVTSFVPGSGPPGTVVTINGSAFTGAFLVRFGNATASFTVVSYSKITATVPGGATTGPISVITFGGKGTSGTDFVVT